MKSAAKILATLTGLAVGLIFVVTGVLEFRESRRLTEEGQVAIAKVVGDELASDRRGRLQYHLRVEFHTADGQTIQARVPVEQEEFEVAKKAGEIGILYLPDSPSVCQVGDEAQISYGTLIWGCLFLTAGGLLLLTFQNPPPSRKEAATEFITREMAELQQPNQEYASVNPREFSHLDMNFYNNAGNRLEAMGYRLLQDRESMTFQRMNKSRVMIRTLLSRDGTVMAALYHLQPSLKVRILGATECRVLNLETKLSDDTFVCTSNAETADAVNYPGAIRTRFLPESTPIELVLAAHAKHVAQTLVTKPGVQPVSMESIDDCDRAQQELNFIKAEFRQKTGLTRRELRRMANTSDSAAIATVHSHVLGLRHQNESKAA